MFSFFKKKKDILEEIPSGEFNIRLDLPLRVIYIRRLTVSDFLKTGLMLNFFIEKAGNAGRFATLQKMIDQAEEKPDEIKPEQEEFITTTIKLGMKDYSDDLLDVEKIIIFNMIIAHSCEKFADIVHPDKTIALNCHYLAKNYGGDPWGYIDQPLDKFLFNLYCLNSGLKDESDQMKRAMKKQKIK